MKKKIFLFVICGILLISLTGCGSEEEKKEELTLDNFNLTGTCWEENVEHIQCFDENAVYSVYTNNDELITTNSDSDKAKLSKKNNTEGSFTYELHDLDDVIYGYMVIIKDNSYKLWTTYYDTIENKSVNKEWELSTIKLSDISIKDGTLLKTTILGREFPINNAVLYNGFMDMAFSTYILAQNKELNGDENHYLSPTTPNDTTVYLYNYDKNDTKSDKYQLCYRVGNGTISNNFKGKTKEIIKNEREITINYCNQMQ